LFEGKGIHILQRYKDDLNRFFKLKDNSNINKELNILGKLAEIDTDRPDLPAEVTEQVNILIKYDGYISRQIKQVEKFKKLEKKKLPEKFDYNEISGLRIEAQQKLNEFQPLNIGQASRISGVTPADISVLLVYLEQLKYSNPDLFFKLNPDEHKEKQE
jgi:tRNA uridine 5-carboxymethylaminomethyl modification enzyme